MKETQVDSPYLAFKNVIFSYADFTEVEWELLSNILSQRVLKKHDILIGEGEVCNKIWFIAKGLIRYYQTDIDQNERTTCFAMENHFVTPFSSYLTGAPSHEVLIALEETQLIEINKSDFLTFLDTIPGINLMYRQLIEGTYLHMERLTYSLQHCTALERYKKLILEEAPELLQRVPLVYLASYLGMSPENLSRVRAKI